MCVRQGDPELAAVGAFQEEVVVGTLEVVCDADLADIVPGYLEERKEECRLIRELVGQGKYEEVRTLVHGMKGSGGCYGFPVISELGREMELSAKASDGSGMLEQLRVLEAYLVKVRVRYEEEP